MGGVESNIVGLQQGYSLRGGGGGEPGAVVESNGDQEAAELYVKRYFGGGKGAALEIRQAWQGRRRQGSSGVGGWCRERWVLGCWEGYR